MFTPFSGGWLRHGWPAPASAAVRAALGPHRGRRGAAHGGSAGRRSLGDTGGLELPEVGEQAALERWHAFRDEALDDYADARDRPELDGTSGLSAHLKYGEIHPRTLLADLAGLAERAGTAGDGARTLRSELSWREFYADVLWHHPRSAREYLRAEYAADELRRPGAPPGPPST